MEAYVERNHHLSQGVPILTTDGGGLAPQAQLGPYALAKRSGTLVRFTIQVPQVRSLGPIRVIPTLLCARCYQRI